MGSLISESQSAFLKGRNIADAFVTVRELFGWGSRKGVEGGGIKVDFEKAYDRIYWPFLFRILEWWGFDSKWINWVKMCVCNAKVAVLVNGVPINWIKMKRGLRQGDPLSPFLFLLIAECLTRLTDVAAESNFLCGIGPSNESKIHIIQFADDTFFFCEAKKRFMRNLLFLWQLLEWASGLRINKDKSEIFYMGLVEGKEYRLAQILGCKVGALPSKYLGLPLTTKPLSKEDWRGIIGKVQIRIDGWQAKLLSRGGRLVLVNAVLTNISIYFLTVFQAPKWVVKRIEALRRDFFWRGEVNSPGKGCLVAWKNVCRSKEEGGLGILDITTMNQALLVKWWWKFFTAPNLQWNKLIHVLFYQRRRPLKEGRSFKPSSFWWKGVIGQKDIFNWGISYILGNGQNIDFWTDRWCGESTLLASFQELYPLLPHKTLLISKCFDDNEWFWNKILRDTNSMDHRVHQSITILKERISNFSTRQGTDRVFWRWTPDGRFSVRSTYRMLNNGGTRDYRTNDIWNLRIPLKVKVFAWLVLKKKLPTIDNLLKRGWTGNTSCVLCGLELETLDHLFTQCVFSKFLMAKTLHDVQLRELGADVHQLWDIWKERENPFNGNYGLAGIIACWLVIWETRNGVIFAKAKADPIRVTHTIKLLIASWGSADT